MEEIARGAEAVLFREKDVLIKHRIKKSYRHQNIDFSRRKYCTRREAKLIEKAKNLVNVPELLDFSDSDMIIRMRFIDGFKVRDVLSKKNFKEICRQIGKQIAILHSNDIIHGDLTTSNFILNDSKVFFIDFGLGFFSAKPEDKAVDLHLLYQALNSKHYEIVDDCFDVVINSYKKHNKDYVKVLERLKAVEKRGRYKRKKQVLKGLSF